MIQAEFNERDVTLNSLPHLSRIIVENFLNFSREEVILDPRFTVITGPNGSGKSSIFQCIKFALGSNDRDERYHKWADFIHFGRDYARVELEIFHQNIPCHIRRTVLRNGKITYEIQHYGMSNYAPVPKSQVDELVASLGYNPSNIFAFVSQGRIDVIKNMDPQGLCAYVEEGLGLFPLRQRIEQEEARLQSLNSDLQELQQRRNTYDIELDMLRPKLERLAQKRQINANINLLKEELLLANRKQIIGNIETNKEQKYNSLEQIASLDAEIAQNKSQDDEISQKIEKIDAQLNDLFMHDGAKKNDYADIEAEIRTWEDDKQEFISKLRGLERDLAEYNANFLQKSQVEEKIRERLDNVTALADDARARHTGLLEERKTVEETLTEFTEWQVTYTHLQDELSEKLTKKVELDAKVAGLNSRSAELFDKISQIDHKSGKIYKILEKYDENFQQNFSALRSSLRKSIFSQESSLRELQSDKERLLDELSRYERVMAGKASIYPPDVRKIKAEVDRRNWEVRGPLLEILHFDPKYSRAIESIFGKTALYSFVAFDREIFLLLTELRKKLRAFCKIFMPKPGRLNPLPAIRLNTGVLGYLDGLIAVDGEEDGIRKVIRAIVNDTIVVERSTVALDLHQQGIRSRCVTLDGEILISHEQAEESRPSKHLREHLDIQQMRSKVEEIQCHLGSAQQAIDEGAENASVLRAKLEKLEKVGQVLPRLQELCQMKEDLTSENHRINIERAKIECDFAVLAQEIADLEHQIQVIESDIGADILNLQERSRSLPREIEECLTNLTSIEQAKEGTVRDFQIAREAVTEIKSALDYCQHQIDTIREEIETQDTQILVKFRELRKLEKCIQGIEDHITKSKVDKDQANLEKKTCEEEFFRLKLEEERWQTTAEKLEEIITELEQALRHLMESLANNPNIDQEHTRPTEEIQDDLTRSLESLQDYYDVDESLETRRDEVLESIERVQESRVQVTEDIQAAAGVSERLRTEFFEKLHDVLGELAERMNEKFQKYGIHYQCALELEGDFPALAVHLVAGGEGQPLTAIAALSGGQRTMVAINLVLALQSFNPSPFIIFDEAEMFLDKKNATVVSQIVGETTDNGVQIVMLMPDASKGLITLANKVIGVALAGPQGSSTVIPDPQVLQYSRATRAGE